MSSSLSLHSLDNDNDNHNERDAGKVIILSLCSVCFRSMDQWESVSLSWREEKVLIEWLSRKFLGEMSLSLWMSVDPMWKHLPIDRTSTPRNKRIVNEQPKTSTPICQRSFSNRQRNKMKKSKKINRKKKRKYSTSNSFLQIWFL